jgi:hypothetical protein
MKKYLFGLLGLALAAGAPLLGQSPAPVPHATIGAPMVVCPDTACCVPTKTVCVPEHYLKKTTKPVYGSRCEPICLCYFRGLFGGHCCDGSGHCEKPYTRRYMIKWTRTCEQEAVKCVPAQVPACTGGH